jgi:hypothetical protein
VKPIAIISDSGKRLSCFLPENGTIEHDWYIIRVAKRKREIPAILFIIAKFPAKIRNWQHRNLFPEFIY